MSTLEQRYAEKEAADQTIVAKIRQACATFMQQHPEYLPTQANEQILFTAMSAPANDHLVPTSVASWEDVYAQCRERLEQKPAASQQRRSPVKPGLTHDELDQMTSAQYQRRLESDPTFEEKVNALGPRK